MSDEFKFAVKSDGSAVAAAELSADLEARLSAEHFVRAPDWPEPHGGPLDGMAPDLSVRDETRAVETRVAADEAFRIRQGLHIPVDQWARLSDDEKIAAVAEPRK